MSFSQTELMGPFELFLAEFPIRQNKLVVWDRKMNVVFAQGRAYMMFNPMVQNEKDRRRLINGVTLLVGAREDQLLLGCVSGVDYQKGVIIATFEDTICATAEERFYSIALQRHDIIWFF